MVTVMEPLHALQQALHPNMMVKQVIPIFVL